MFNCQISTKFRCSLFNALESELNINLDLKDRKALQSLFSQPDTDSTMTITFGESYHRIVKTIVGES